MMIPTIIKNLVNFGSQTAEI